MIGNLAQREHGAERPRASVCDAPPRVPLHIKATRVTTVDLDGPALRVRAMGHSVARYPLARVLRVVVRGPVQWRSEALAALMEAGIPVVLMGKNGDPAGYCWPADRPTVPFAADLGQFLDRPDWQERYNNWLRSARIRILERWRRSQQQAGMEITPWHYQELVRRHVYLHGSQPTPGRNSLRRGAIAAVVASHLSRAGLAPSYCGWGGGRLDLVGDVTDLLELAFELELGSLGVAVRGDEPAMLRMLSPVVARLPQQCIELLGCFARWVRETNDPWH